ncbi:MAG: VWA domain-containing protein [Elusimicrobiota bacterium]
MKLEFASPWLGLACLILGLGVSLIIQILKHKKVSASAALIYSKAEHNYQLLNQQSGLRRRHPSSIILALIRAAALAVLVLALMRPQKVTTEQLEPLLGVDIALALDTSGSMQALDFQPFNRLQGAKKIASEFVDKRGSDRIGIVAFGGAAILACPLTLDKQAVQSFLEQVEINMTQTDGTAIGSAIMVSLAHLKKVPSKSKTIILLTDGRNNAGSVDPVTGAKTARALGVKIYTIGTGKRGGGIFPVVDPIFGTRYIRRPEEEIDEDTLTKVAEITEGKYFRATELNELKGIFEEIDRLEKTEAAPPKTHHYEELYPPLLMAALFLLGTEILLRGTLLLTLP